jgi:hypothetical protein
LSKSSGCEKRENEDGDQEFAHGIVYRIVVESGVSAPTPALCKYVGRS